jgi:hypothetical protein
MRIKILKVWLFLLPVIGIIGTVLYIQSSNNITELEEQNLRSIQAVKNDMQAALPDYYQRVEGYIFREAYAVYSEDSISKESQKFVDLLANVFQPDIEKVRLVGKSQVPLPSLSLDQNELSRKNLKVKIPSEKMNYFTSYGFTGKFEASSESIKDAVIIDVTFPIEELLRKQENNKVFQQFFILNGQGEVVYPEEQLGLQLLEPFPLTRDSLGVVRSGVYHEVINFSGFKNRAYIAPVTLENLQLFAVGTVPEAQFMKVGLRINFSLLSILLFFLVILISSVPILAILNLGLGDSLTRSKILQVGLSLLGLTLILGFAFSFFKNIPDPLQETKNIRLTLDQQFTDSLCRFNTILRDFQDKGEKNTFGQVNELIEFSDDGLAKQMYFQGPGLDLNFGDGSNSPIDLSDRAYFTYFKEGDSSVFINSHYSRGSGQLESVISRKTNEGNIHAVTFKLQPDSDISKNFRFLLIKEDGGILYKSQKIISPISNLKEGVSLVKWHEIESILENNRDLGENQTLEVPFYLNGHQYTGVFSRIRDTGFDQPVWMVFLVNHNLTHVFSSLSSLEAVLILSAYFLILLLSMAAQGLSRQLLTDFGFNTFLFEWLKPTQQNLRKLKYLTFAFLIYGGIVLTIYYYLPLDPIRLLLLLIISSLWISFINLATDSNSSKGSSSKKYHLNETAYAPLGINLMIILVSVLSGLISWIPILILSLSALVLTYLWHGFVKKIPGRIKIIPASKVLPVYLVTWFLLVGFIPGYLIQSKTQIFESKIWNSVTSSEKEEQNLQLESLEKSRRSIMMTVTDPFDQKILDFITPNQTVFRAAMQGTSKNLSFGIGWIGVIGLLFLFGFLIYYLQRTIFFTFEPVHEDNFDLSQPKLFVCSIDSGHFDEIMDQLLSNSTKTVAKIDFLTQEINWQFKVDTSYDMYIFQNFHCLADPTKAIEIIENLDGPGKTIWICSGKTWPELLSKIKDNDQSMRFSEAFSDFRFKFLAIPHETLETVPGFEKPEILLREMRSRKAFFTNMWAELSFLERLVCYSFAQEGFFSPARKDVMIGLAQKGVLKPKDTKVKKPVWLENPWLEWQLYSPVFRKYILDQTSESELEAFRVFEKKQGNAQSIQVSLVSFALICLALIGIFDQNFFSEAYAYLTGSLGLLGSVYALLNRGLLNFKFGKSNS